MFLGTRLLHEATKTAALAGGSAWFSPRCVVCAAPCRTIDEHPLVSCRKNRPSSVPLTLGGIHGLCICHFACIVSTDSAPTTALPPALFCCCPCLWDHSRTSVRHGVDRNACMNMSRLSYGLVILMLPTPSDMGCLYVWFLPYVGVHAFSRTAFSCTVEVVG